MLKLKNPTRPRTLVLAASLLVVLPAAAEQSATSISLHAATVRAETSTAIAYRTVRVDGLDIFFREAGPKDGPVVLLLHGFPTSSHMYRNLIPALADRYHVVAPDFPGFGQSSMPPPGDFDYTFDRLSRVIERFIEVLGLRSYSLYLMDYGAPVGFRVAARNPDRVEALVIQNGNAYEEGLREFWDRFRTLWSDPSEQNRDALRIFLTLDATRWQYTLGIRDVTRISPDTWTIDQRQLDRPGNQEIQLALFYDYRTNVALYPEWQAYLRRHQPPTLIVWGKNDVIFPPQGAVAFLRDVPGAELHLLDTGHFALEEDGAVIAELMRRFLAKHARVPASHP